MKRTYILMIILCLFISGCAHKLDENELDSLKNDVIQDEYVDNNKQDEETDDTKDIVNLDEEIDSNSDDSDEVSHVEEGTDIVMDDTPLDIHSELTAPSYDPSLDEDKLLDLGDNGLPKPGLLGPDSLNKEEITFLHTRNKFEDIVFDDTLNVYVFWGNRCQHCTHLIEYLESLLKEEPDLFKLYTFEVWYDEENMAWLEELALITEEEIEGVPYMIIGKDVFVGYDPIIDEDIYDSITHRHRKDIILDWSLNK